MGVTYKITWTRPQDPGEEFTCIKLTAKMLVRRLRAAAINFGEVTVLSIEKEDQ